MANTDIVVLQEQSDGSLKEVLLTPSVINAQYDVIIANTAPSVASVADNQIWIRKTDLQQFFLYNDGDTRQWIQLPPVPHTHSEFPAAGFGSMASQQKESVDITGGTISGSTLIDCGEY